MSRTSDAQKSGPLPSGRILRQRLDNGELLLGFCLSLPAPAILEIAKDYDWFWIDGQHGQLSYDTILHCVRVADLVGVPAIVRVAGHDYSQIGPVLDTAPAGVMVPMIHDADQAKIALSQSDVATIGCRHAGKTLSVQITREQFQDMTADLLQRTADTAQLVLEPG